MEHKGEKGQAIIIILLIMIVGLTIGLSVVSRSLLNVKLSTEQEESSRAFTAAEAGIEISLESGTAQSGEIGSPGDLSSYTCTKNNIGAQGYVFFPNVLKDKVVQLYFANPENIETTSFTSSKITVYWGIESTTDSALEVNLIYKDRGDSLNPYHLAKVVLDPDSSRANNNHFCTTTGGCDSILTNFSNGDFIISGVPQHFGSQATINVGGFNSGNNFLQIARFRILYAGPSRIGVTSSDPASDFPSQGALLDCLGTREASGISRRVHVLEYEAAVPEVFDYVLYNGNTASTMGH